MGIVLLYYITIYVLEKAKPTNVILLHGIGVGTGIGWIVIRFIKEVIMPTSVWILTICILWGLSVLTVIDCKRHKIPNNFLKILLFIWLIVMIVDIILNGRKGFGVLFLSLAGALLGGFLFLLCYIISKRRLGAGDVKLVFILGLFLTGQKIIEVIFYSMLVCFLFCFIQVYGRKIGRKKEFPMTPFFYLGTWITLLNL